ncbi:MAG TPA: YsnF/AvaK domain-containing protein [Pseudomonadota bacterium]|nr:YsnF/AvaK domain-containing protein [Pseudomonadota bacterium]
MNKTIVGVFDDFAEAQKVVQELVEQGVPRSEISMVASADASGRAGDSTLGAVNLQSGGSLMASGSFGKALGGTGAALTQFGLNADMARVYQDAVCKSGKVLVAVQASEDRLTSFSDLMRRYRTSDLSSEFGAIGQSEVVLPVMQESLQVGKREVQRGGVHVHSYITETPVEESVRLREERVSVERHPANRPVTVEDAAAFKDGSFEVRQTAEEVVVAKEARVVEEVVINKQVAERTETVRDTVRRTDVVVEDLSGKDDLQTRRDRYAQYEPEFRQNYSQTYANSEYDYDRVAPAYRFGTELGNLDQQKDWQALESDARTHWETKSPGTWDRMKDAIRYAWERVRDSVSG